MKRRVKRRVQRIAQSLILATLALAVLRIAVADTPGTVSAPAAPTATPAVNISNFSFQPAVLVVKAGTKVTWTNHDSTPHTVTSSDQHFSSSGGLDTNDRYSVVFDKPGTYEYFCSLHPMMVGKVIVQPGN